MISDIVAARIWELYRRDEDPDERKLQTDSALKAHADTVGDIRPLNLSFPSAPWINPSWDPPAVWAPLFPACPSSGYGLNARGL